ncbi:50S ribosomal protein L10 [Blattabacterium sp. (Blaberus giganteus)]|uniref:50S ribosomal protein L10 n=1 Tax=Blattabacterium sp. (Blaberus giganteus) TaxID=1186051 RepID=UPI00025F6FCF|nr:50S ribosomal protein L10 [Blattabacterium sp. (Blaberus giganteus)]AFJ90886.1 putative 50S ribosomal protein L10 [Blattabacterium sp. (Blaberus giganteus)]
MNKKNKKKELLKLVSILSNNETIYLMDMSDLNSNQISALRKNFHEHSIRMKMVKNTLLKKAINKIKNKKFDSFFPILNGNTTILFSNLNVLNVSSKIIKNFHIQEKIDKPYLKGAYAQESFYFGGNKDLNLLLHIKSKEDIITEILNVLQFSIKDIVSSLLNSTKYKICEVLKSLSSYKVMKE